VGLRVVAITEQVPAPDLTAKPVPLRTLLSYATGTGAASLTLGGIGNFGMLYYTQIIGLSAKLVGIVFCISMIWSALIGPVMGHVIDNMRSRFGRYHPSMLLGGLLLGISFYFVWDVPELRANHVLVFLYLVAINLILTTAAAMFGVPYGALGFKMCASYEERSRLQGIGLFFSQFVNFFGGALAWVLFFPDRNYPDGTRVDGSHIAHNYVHMSVVLTASALIFVLICVWATKSYAIDNRSERATRLRLSTLIPDVLSLVSDRYARYVYCFFGILSVGTMIVGQVEMFTYGDFMRLTHVHKAVAEGMGMIASAAGGLLQTLLVIRYDKKQAGYIGVGIGVFGGFMLLILFIGGVLRPEQTWTIPNVMPLIGGGVVPIAALIFSLFLALWWGGMGVVGPLAMSMMADISEINYRRSGLLKDAGYASAFSFVSTIIVSVGTFISGWALDSMGYVSGAVTQSLEVSRNMAILTFISGPVSALLALPFLWKYPIDRAFMTRLSEDDGHRQGRHSSNRQRASHDSAGGTVHSEVGAQSACETGRRLASVHRRSGMPTAKQVAEHVNGQIKQKHF